MERAVSGRRAQFLSRGRRAPLRSVADRLLGSPQIYGHKEREAEASVNFVTCHDGFTLNDLVSYNVKHNEANGESNRDGTDDNRSWNCGVEGPTDDPDGGGSAEPASQEFADLHDALAGHAHDRAWAMKCAARNAATTTLTARTTRPVGSTGRWFRSTPTCSVSCSCSSSAARARFLEDDRSRRDPEPLAPRVEQSLARRKTESTRLEQLVAQHRIERGDRERTGSSFTGS